MTSARTLALVPASPEPVAAIVKRLRAEARARTIASIGAHRPANDVRHYAGGHVWRRNQAHVDMVLRVKEALEA